MLESAHFSVIFGSLRPPSPDLADRRRLGLRNQLWSPGLVIVCFFYSSPLLLVLFSRFPLSFSSSPQSSPDPRDATCNNLLTPRLIMPSTRVKSQATELILIRNTTSAQAKPDDLCSGTTTVRYLSYFHLWTAHSRCHKHHFSVPDQCLQSLSHLVSRATWTWTWINGQVHPPWNFASKTDLKLHVQFGGINLHLHSANCTSFKFLVPHLADGMGASGVGTPAFTWVTATQDPLCQHPLHFGRALRRTQRIECP